MCFYCSAIFLSCTRLFRLSTFSTRQGTITKIKLRLPTIVCISAPSLLLVTGRSVCVRRCLSSRSTSKRSDVWEIQLQQRRLYLFIHSFLRSFVHSFLHSFEGWLLLRTLLLCTVLYYRNIYIYIYIENLMDLPVQE